MELNKRQSGIGTFSISCSPSVLNNLSLPRSPPLQPRKLDIMILLPRISVQRSRAQIALQPSRARIALDAPPESLLVLIGLNASRFARVRVYQTSVCANVLHDCHSSC
ncbi:hypothetical protein BC826DRAFT_1189295 [Russula brevipes]|nr:hypothetical protein BC826DRAFT_1189295 [Russula brevipes]